MDKTWKRFERDVAKMFGARRVPVSGRQRGDAPDIEHDEISFELKYRESLPKWIHDAMDQAEKSSNNKDKIPVVVLRERQQKLSESFVLLRLDEFYKLMTE